jgi:hypothetical protein
VADRVLDPSPDGSYRKNTIYEWEKNKYVPNAVALGKLVELYGVSGHWLLTGDGPMHLPDGADAYRLEVIGKVVNGTIDDATVRKLAATSTAEDGKKADVSAKEAARVRKERRQQERRKEATRDG